jgi:NADPH:quinone reductase-like Zn-dependent oxidoreductase
MNHLLLSRRSTHITRTLNYNISSISKRSLTQNKSINNHPSTLTALPSNKRTPTTTMHQAQVNAWGETPKYTSVPDPGPPSADQIRIKTTAVGIHRVVRSRVAGKHYSSGTPPHVPGIDGVGTTEDGKTVYWFTWDVGSLSQYVNVPKNSVRELPEGVDPVQVAAGVNPAMSSWMAFRSRTNDLPKGFTVLILGATSASGRIAMPLARSMGAGKIIGAARNKSTLSTLGLDESIVIAEDPKETDFSSLGDVDVVLDYVYGGVTEKLFQSLKPTRPTQYVHIGALASPKQEINLAGPILRSKNLTIRGSGPGAWSLKEFAGTIGELLQAIKDAPEQPVRVAKLEDVEKVWGDQGSERLVIVMD